MVATSSESEAAPQEAIAGHPTATGASGDVIPVWSPFPTADSTTSRATATWWFVFLGPAALAAALSVAGATAGRVGGTLVFTLGVWAFTLTLGLAAAPRGSLWWAVPLAVSFLAAGLGLGLLVSLDAAAHAMSDRSTL